MITLHNGGVYLVDGEVRHSHDMPACEARKNTMAAGILAAHNTSGDEKNLKIKFDAMVSHDITYVGIIQTERADDLQRQLEQAQEQLNSREVQMTVIGSIAEASLQLSGVFAAAQTAADMYLSAAKDRAAAMEAESAAT